MKKKQRLVTYLSFTVLVVSIIVFFLSYRFYLASQTKISPVKRANTERFGMIIKLKPEKKEEYKALHANPWPGVLNMIKECNIQNYSIFLKDSLLFSYFEYTGNDFAADMERMTEDSLTREWWKRTDPCQIPMKSREQGERWVTMEEVFHTD